ncbi:hypothetical protein [Mangrovimonas aestuarii]|uniref:hypothetical protein n=1 Tax=Mangrovimonas aestuarii TaxID=3018443 RepID=UPI002377E31F|nr:hypothetical protein [Mangrovimonas aestuarii]
MKKSTLLLFALFALFLSACEGPRGPQGPPGQPGAIFVASAFEIEVDFNANNDYSIIEPYGFEVFPSDVTLVYILWEVQNGTDIWRPLPQDAFFNEGVLQYNYDFTDIDVRIFLDGYLDFDSLPSAYTQNQIFRVVVVPADYLDSDIDINNLDEVMQQFNLDDSDFTNK